MRIVVTGAKEGQLARSLLERAGGDLEVFALGPPELDLARPGDLAPLFDAHKPDVIVNAAAHTAVDKAESERELAFAINASGAGDVARAAKALGISVIQISTDYVFDGTGNRPMLETDPTGPMGVYGASKLAGEQQVQAATVDYAILRTAWVYAPFGANFVRTMLRLAKTKEELGVVADQWGTPNSALDLAAAVETTARNLLREPENLELRGVFHMTAAGGPVSWAEFAAEIFVQSAARGGPSARVRPIATAEYPTPAKRPAWSLLDGTKLQRMHGVVLPDWRDGLKRTMDRLAGEGEWR